jgi:predicted amidohydrolase YtcJ
MEDTVSQITVYHNGKIATNAVPSLAEAMAIEDGKIVAIG